MIQPQVLFMKACPCDLRAYSDEARFRKRDIRIRKALCDYPEAKFEIDEFAGGVMATFIQLNSGTDLTGQVTAEILRMLDILKDEMSRQELQAALVLNSRNNFDKRYLKSAIDLGLIEPTIPDKPNSRLQKYRLTTAGKVQLLSWKGGYK